MTRPSLPGGLPSQTLPMHSLGTVLVIPSTHAQTGTLRAVRQFESKGGDRETRTYRTQETQQLK